MTAAQTAVTLSARAKSLSGLGVPAARDEKSPALGVQVPSPALPRTVVPAVVGYILATLASHGVQVDGTAENLLTAGLTGILGGAYYITVTAVQSRWPLAGVLLGSTAVPTYEGRHRKKAIPGPTTATSDSPPEDRL